MEILYHLPNNGNRIRSPFDIAINILVANKSIKIACPYLSLDYFEKVIIEGCKEWVLLTDINALIKSQQNRCSVSKMMNFIEKNKNNIRHLTNLHAKIIIAEEKSFVGSANFTHSGISENNELSIIVDGDKELQKISNWYNEWWENAEILDTEKIKVMRIRSQSQNSVSFGIGLRKSGLQARFSL
jgi:hypothetical protein